MNAFRAAQRRYDNLSPEDIRPEPRLTEDDFKRCRTCGETKPLTEFQSRLSHICLQCDAELSEILN